MSQTFGFDHEIMLLFADYPTIEPRTMQAAESFFLKEPAKGRVDQSIYFLVTPASDGREWVTTYTMRNPQSRIPVVFNTSELTERRGDDWNIRNIIGGQLFARDLFDYKLPIDNDLYFFGRDAVVADHLNAIKQSQNRGLFGLRKTGKTSLLYKLKRAAERDFIGKVIYYDCKLPAIRNLRWFDLLRLVMEGISDAYGLQAPTQSDNQKISQSFIDLIKKTPIRYSTCLVFDEIEWISPVSKKDPHWQEDFVPFWQTLWAAQSEVRRLSNIIAGVNPYIVEIDVVAGVQNPMFGIVQTSYLKGLDIGELRSMLHFFGRRMGMSFQQDAIDYLHERYGGHPLLTRLACSQVHHELQERRDRRPVQIGSVELKKNEDSRDAELMFYCKHVVSELKEFYHDEYEMLELLATERMRDYMDLRSAPEYARHLKDYGLVTEDPAGKPRFAIPVVGRYIGADLARQTGKRLRRHIIPESERRAWTKRRAEVIIKEIRELEQLASRHSWFPLYGNSSFPEAERFASVTPCETQDDFMKFTNVCNRCFVESIELVGREKGIANYFWKDVKSHYPEYWDALQRIKVYRHNANHIELNSTTEVELQRFLLVDLEGHRQSEIPDVWFVLQQCVLDGMLVGITCEINRLS